MPEANAHDPASESPPKGQILGPFASLVLGQFLGAGLGFLFWVLTARYVEPDVVGLAAGAINALTLLSTVAMVGLGTMLIGELGRTPEIQRRALVRNTIIANVVIGGALAVVTVACSPILGHTLAAALAQPWVALCVVVGSAAGAVGLVLDQAILGIGRSTLQIWRNFITSGLRFPIAAVCVFGFDLRSPSVILVCWVVPIVISDMVVWWRLALPRPRVAGERFAEFVRRVWRAALHNHALNLSLSAGPMLVPVVASVVLIPRENASFAVAWLMATFAFVPPYMLATALFAATVNQTTRAFAAQMRRTLPAALAMCVVIVIATWLVSSHLIAAFGGHYRENSAHLLDLLVLGGVSMIFKDHLVAYARVADKLVIAAKIAALAVATEITAALAGGMIGGADGVVIGWLGALALQALCCLPLIFTLMTRTGKP